MLIGAGGLLLLSQPSPSPPLCRVRAAGLTTSFGVLRDVAVRLAPDCPPNGRAFIRLESPSGATDPVYDFYELDTTDPAHRFFGVLPHWKLKWRAASGTTYTVPER